jgi:hypothetical protein
MVSEPNERKRPLHLPAIQQENNEMHDPLQNVLLLTLCNRSFRFPSNHLILSYSHGRHVQMTKNGSVYNPAAFTCNRVQQCGAIQQSVDPITGRRRPRADPQSGKCPSMKHSFSTRNTERRSHSIHLSVSYHHAACRLAIHPSTPLFENSIPADAKRLIANDENTFPAPWCALRVTCCYAPLISERRSTGITRYASHFPSSFGASIRK